MLRIFIFLLAALCSFSGVFAEAVKIRLKTALPCEAEINENRAEYAISVRMSSITCFDSALNRHISLTKVQNMALYALFEYLDVPADQVLKCSRIKVLNQNFTKEKTTLECQIAKDSVHIEKVKHPQTRKAEAKRKTTEGKTAEILGGKSEVKQDKTPERKAFTSVLTLENDYAELIEMTVSACLEETVGIWKESETLTDLENQCTEAQTRFQNRFDELQKRIESERFLLSYYKKELNKTAAEEAEKVGNELKSRMKLFAEIRKITNTLPTLEEIPKSTDEINLFFSRKQKEAQTALKELMKKSQDGSFGLTAPEISKAETLLERIGNIYDLRLENQWTFMLELDGHEIITLDESFFSVLTFAPELLAFPGAKLLPDGDKTVFLASGSAVVSDGTKPGKIREDMTRKAAVAKAQAELVKFLKSEVEVLEEIYTEYETLTINGRSSGITREEYLRDIQIRAKGLIRDFNIVLSWKSRDEDGTESIHVILAHKFALEE